MKARIFGISPTAICCLAIFLLLVTFSGIVSAQEPEKIFVLPDSADVHHNTNGTQVLKNINGDTYVDKYLIVIGDVGNIDTVNEFTIDPGNAITYQTTIDVTLDAKNLFKEAVKSNLMTNKERKTYLEMMSNNAAKLFYTENILPIDSLEGTYIVGFQVYDSGSNVKMYNSTFELMNHI